MVTNVEWLVEFEGQRKPLSEIRTHELRNLIEPIRAHIASALEPTEDEPDFARVRVVFLFDPADGLKFSIEGAPLALNRAMDRIGIRAKSQRARTH